jgi:hypothetical protein
MAVITTVFTISVTVQPRLKSFTGLFKPCKIGPIAIAPEERCTALRGVAIFAKACFGHPSPSKQQKLNATG